MKVPLILQDINNKIIPRKLIVTTPSLFIKSFSRFGIRIQDDYEIDFIDGRVTKIEDDKIFDTPYIYSVISPTNIQKERVIKPENANFSYTLYLGKTEKTITLEIVNIFDEINDDNYQTLVIEYKPNNVQLESQQHYNDLLINNDLPDIKKLLPAIIRKESEHDLIRKLLLDFKEIKKHRGKLKSIEKFLNFIGFDPESIKLYAEYTTPNSTTTINPNKNTDYKNGFYHVLYDNWIIDDDEPYTRKNLPKGIIQITNLEELFDKLFYALVLANDYFTIPEQQMSFFGLSNFANSEQFLSITSNMTQVYYIDTLSNLKSFNINIYNKTIMDSLPLYIVKNKVQKIDTVKISEVKLYVGNHIKQNDYLFMIEKEISDNNNDTDLTDEEELNIEYRFGNILNFEIHSKNNKVQYTIKNMNNELIQFNSEQFILTNNVLDQKIFVGLFGTYQIKVRTWDYYGNREEYIYYVKISDTNIDYDIFNSTVVSDDYVNEVTQDVDSPMFSTNENLEPLNAHNLLLINSQNNNLLESDLTNYFDIVANENHKYLYGYKPYLMNMMNKNFAVKDVTETLPAGYIDNFLNIISIKKFDEYDYIFSDNLFVKLMEIKIDDIISELHWFITTKTNSVNLSKYLHSIDIIYKASGLTLYTIDEILKKNIPNQLEYKSVIIPINYDFELYEDLDSSDESNLPLPTIDPIKIKSVFPRLKNIDIDDINENDDKYSLKLGDIIFAKIDERYVVNVTDIKWTVYNSFTNEIVHEEKNYTLKYRIIEKALYSIKLTLSINGETYVIDKKEIQTSFIL